MQQTRVQVHQILPPCVLTMSTRYSTVLYSYGHVQFVGPRAPHELTNDVLYVGIGACRQWGSWGLLLTMFGHLGVCFNHKTSNQLASSAPLKMYECLGRMYNRPRVLWSQWIPLLLLFVTS